MEFPPFRPSRNALQHGVVSYCAFGFWKGALVVGDAATSGAMGQLGRITKLSDLPSKRVLVGWIRKAMELNERGIKAPRKIRSPKIAVKVPVDLKAALQKSARALAVFEKFSPSCKREYVEWIEEAKREETRQRRLVMAIEWISEGKRRNWKYEKCR